MKLRSLTVDGFTEKQTEEEKPQREEERRKKKSEEQISKYRQLLRGIQDKEKKLQEDKDMEMEITWVPGDFTFLLSVPLKLSSTSTDEQIVC